MKASVVDLRYKTKEILKALNRNEAVTILYHGKIKGTIVPSSTVQNHESVKSHPFFGSLENETQSVGEQMQQLRGLRYRDL